MRTGLTLEGLTKTYPTPDGTSRFVVMQDFTLTLEPGEFVCLVGHSGCGKSTALSIAAGLNTADAGHVTVNGAVVDGPGLDRGVVFQAPCLLPWLSALDNVRLGIDQAKPKLAKKERVALAMRYLEKVGLGDAAHVRPSELSQGMQQRVGIARAFALAPRVLLLDEPFGMLDSLTRVELQEVLLHLWRAERTTALMVTHDVDEALFLADRVALMTNGPDARLGAVLTVPFSRPRERHEVMAHPAFFELREDIMTFLEDARATSGHRRPSARADQGSTDGPRRRIANARPCRIVRSDAYGRGLPTDTWIRSHAASPPPSPSLLPWPLPRRPRRRRASPPPATPPPPRLPAAASPPSRSRSRPTASPTSTSSPTPTR